MQAIGSSTGAELGVVADLRLVGRDGAASTALSDEGRGASDAGCARKRRQLLVGGCSGAAGMLLAGCALPGAQAPAQGPDPFTLGVASGYPTVDGFVLWTRLVPEAPTLPDSVSVSWEVAADEGMRGILARGSARASAEAAHSVHVEVAGLPPGRWYWYRFAALGHRSRIGRTRTLPPANAAVARLRLGIASCQNIEHGYFAAYRHMIADEPDLVVHLGDYIYEGTWGQDLVRPLRLGEAQTLAEYRHRHAVYKRDPDLQDAHAMFPWVMVWDDHEVANDYADASPERILPPEIFLRRRADAYRAYFEHMPMPRRMAPQDASMRIHTAFGIGDLAVIHLLDHRQYRSPQACPMPGRGGGNVVEPGACAALGDPSRSVLGIEQERWLGRSFAAGQARWNLIAQQTLMAPLRMPGRHGAASRVRTDGWDGYPLSRQRLLDGMIQHRLRNPVVLGGDLHAFHAADLHARPDDPESALIASEFVTTSITSQAPGQDHFERLTRINPHLRHADGRQRGYLRITLGREQLEADLMGLADVRRRDSGLNRQAAFVVEAGRPGPRPA